MIGGLFTLIVVLLSEDVLFPTSKVGWAAVLGLGLLAQVVGQGLLTYSLKQFSSSLVAVFMLAIPIISAFLAFFIFSEHLSLQNWLAFAIVLVGIYLSISAPRVAGEIEATLSTEI
ncbi:MAG: DMT family transporter [Phormidesmis sp.]